MYIFFDTETTGLPKNWKAPITDSDNWPRMVQLAWQHYDEKGNLLNSNNYLIRPSGFTIPEAAFKIHGISTERAWNEGRELEQALIDFSRATAEAKFLVAHNIAFDLKIVGAELLRLGLPVEALDMPQLDTMKAGASVCQLPSLYGGFKAPSLTELHRHLFNEDFDGAHDALADVEACARSFFALKERGAI